MVGEYQHVNADIAHQFLLPSVRGLFSPAWFSNEAQAMLLAIALQESDFTHRQQLIGHHRNWWESLKGPAASFWQFEKIGLSGVLSRQSTRSQALHILKIFGYPEDVNTIHQALAHNDLLAVCFARLLLYSIPDRLPFKHEAAEGWNQYLKAWRPGRPSPDRWAARWHEAWSIVEGARRVKVV